MINRIDSSSSDGAELALGSQLEGAARQAAFSARPIACQSGELLSGWAVLGPGTPRGKRRARVLPKAFLFGLNSGVRARENGSTS